MLSKIFLISLIFIILIIVNKYIFENISTKSLKCNKKIIGYEFFKNSSEKNNKNVSLKLLYNFQNRIYFNEYNYSLKDISNNNNDLYFNEMPIINNNGLNLNNRTTGVSNSSNKIGIFGSGPFTIIWSGNSKKNSFGKIFEFSVKDQNNFFISEDCKEFIISHGGEFKKINKNLLNKDDFYALICDQYHLKFYNGSKLMGIWKSNYVKLNSDSFKLNPDKTLNYNMKHFIIYNKILNLKELKEIYSYYNSQLFDNYKKPNISNYYFAENDENKGDFYNLTDSEKIKNVCLSYYNKNGYNNDKEKQINKCVKILTDFGIGYEINSDIYNCIINSSNSGVLFNKCLSKLSKNKIVNQRLQNVCNLVADNILKESIDHTVSFDEKNNNLIKQHIKNKCYNNFISNNATNLLASNSNYNCFLRANNYDEFNDCMNKLLSQENNNLEKVCNKYYDLIKDSYSESCKSIAKEWGLASFINNQNIDCINHSNTIDDFKNCLTGNGFNLNDENTPIKITENISNNENILSNIQTNIDKNNINSYKNADEMFNKYFIVNYDNKKKSNKSVNEINYERTGNPAWLKSVCPKLPDMSKYIRRDKIPCWGCNIPFKKKCEVKDNFPVVKYPDNCPKIPDMDQYIKIDEIPCYNCKIPYKKKCKNSRSEYQ